MSIETELISHLRRSLPMADRVTVREAYIESVARHALLARDEAPWGRSIPEDVFRAFVLFPRVNNEDAVFYHRALYEPIKPRLAGLSMEQAVLEVNRWCFEQATYQPTDGRTANALTVIRRGFGRCGEESVLLVCALRAVAIPARQVYVPRWSHCDDNHAWVEAWVDGVWRYLGACEPEPVLDCGWFTASASKAMLVSTRAYGLPSAGETLFVNHTSAYAKTRTLTVRVTENGAPKPGVTVRFELANEGELFPIYQQRTDSDGRVSLELGLGSIHLHAHDGRRYLCRMVDVAREGACALDFAEAVGFEKSPSAFYQRPPMETKMQPCAFAPEVADTHRARMAEGEAVRRARHAAERDERDPILRAARLNVDEIRRFRDAAPGEAEDREALLTSLREKDLGDATVDMLTDALATALPAKARYPRDVWVESVLCPRVGNEMLYPVRAWLRDRTGPLTDARQAWDVVRERMRLCEAEPASLCPDLRGAWEAGECGAKTRDTLYVSVCRAHGIAARLNPADGGKEYYDGDYRALEPVARGDARLILRDHSGRALDYGVDFTVGVLRDGAFVTLDLHGLRLAGEMALPVSAGRYRVTTCRRQIDGSVSGRLFFAEVAPGGESVLDVALGDDETADKLLRAPLPPYHATADGALIRLPEALTGQAALIAFVAPGQEPTEHFLRELLDARERLADGHIAVRLLIHQEAMATHETLRRVLRELDDARLLLAGDMEAEMAWRRLLHAGDLRLPFSVALDRKGKGLFAFANYHVGSVQALAGMLTENE